MLPPGNPIPGSTRGISRGSLKAGVWLPPSQFEACFVSLAHTKPDVERTLKAASSALADLG